MKIFLIIIISLFSCSTENYKNLNNINSTNLTSIGDSGILIKLLSVEDGRCPTDVDCVWGGNATIKILIINSEKISEERTITTGGEYNEISYEGNTYSVKSLLPYPITTKNYKLTDYSLILNMYKNETPN